MIDKNKTYRTKSGLNVWIHEVKDTGTFPVKGTIVVRSKPLKTRFEIWTVDGRVDVVNNNRSHFDLVEVI